MTEIITKQTLYHVTLKTKDNQYDTYEVVTDVDLNNDWYQHDYDIQYLIDQYGCDVDLDNYQTIVSIDWMGEVDVIEFID